MLATKQIFKILKTFVTLCILSLFITNSSNSHSGRTGPSGCHMDYGTQGYHCHKQKQTNPFQTYYYIKYRGQTYGPYKSYSSCMAAIRGAKIVGGFCTTSR